MRPFILATLVLLSSAVLVLFVLEGAKDKQNVKPLLEVGGKTLKDVAETTTSPIKITTLQETKLGRQLISRFRRLPTHHPSVRRVRRIARRLVKHRSRKDIFYQVDVINSSSPNALAFPGGFILVTTGLLALASEEDDDAELAWVLGHEMMHIEKRHALVQMRLWLAKKVWGRQPFGITQAGDVIEHLLRLTYSENMELEADKGGIALMKKADFNPKLALRLIDKMNKYFGYMKKATTQQSRNPLLIGITLTKQTLHDYLATHPHWLTRKERISKLLQR